MIREEYIVDKKVCELLQDEIKSSHAPILLQVADPTTDPNGNEVVAVIAEYECEDLFSRLLNDAVSKRIALSD